MNNNFIRESKGLNRVSIEFILNRNRHIDNFIRVISNMIKGNLLLRVIIQG